jgi:hypothetical protein
MSAQESVGLITTLLVRMLQQFGSQAPTKANNVASADPDFTVI